MLDRIQSESGIEKQENETIREYITRVSKEADSELEFTEDVIELVERRVFSQETLEDVTTEPLEQFLEQIKDIKSGDGDGGTIEKSTNQNGPRSGTAGVVDHPEPSVAESESRSTNPLSEQVNFDISNRILPESSIPYLESNVSLWSLRYAPILLLFPLVVVPIPSGIAPGAEVATYFQALAYANSGFESLFYIVLQESDASVHLYSLFAAPLVAVGYLEAPRLVSVIFAAISAVVIGVVARQQWGERAGLLAPVVLLSNLYFLRYSWAALSYTVAIALTVGAVAAMYQYDKTGDNWWFVGSLILVVLGVMNHAWEATIGLPLLAIVVWRRDWKAAGLLGVTVFGSVGIVTLLTGLQPNPANTAQYSVIDTGVGILLSMEWWSTWFMPITWENLYPFIKIQRLHFVASLALLPIWIGHTIRYRRRESLLMASWVASGLSIPFLLPGGVVHHYYLWATIAPVTLSAVYVIRCAIKRILVSEGRQFARTAMAWTVVFLCVTSAMQVAAIELGHSQPTYKETYIQKGPIDVKNGEAVAAGNTVRKMGVGDRHQLVFVGDWQTQGFDVYQSGIMRVLIYGGFEMKGTWHRGAVPGGTENSPQIASSLEEARSLPECGAVIVRQSNGEVSVHDC